MCSTADENVKRRDSTLHIDRSRYCTPFLLSFFFTFSLFCSYFLQYADGSRQIIIVKTRQQLGCIDKLRKGIDGIARARYVEKCFISKKKKKKKAEGNRSIHLIEQGRDEPRRAEPIGSLNV